MNKKRHNTYYGLIVALLITLFAIPVTAADIPLMTKETLKEKLDDANVVIVDVRKGRDWKSSEFKIKGALKSDLKDIDSWDKSKTPAFVQRKKFNQRDSKTYLL